MKLYDIIEKIESINPISLFYFYTDSVFYVRKFTDPSTLCGDYFWDLTDEIQKSYGKETKCIEFVSLGPKSDYVEKIINFHCCFF